MPTYDYVCLACDHEFEAFQSIKAAVLLDCPDCAKPKLKRRIGLGAGIIFKGGGFYETDYKRTNAKDPSKADNGSKADGNSDSTKKAAAESTQSAATKDKASAQKTSTT